MDQIGKGLLAIVSMIFTLAIISVIISKKSGTPQVIQAAASALGNVIAAAVQPLSGGSNIGLNTQTLPSIPGAGLF